MAPLWPAQPWWPLLLSLLFEHPVLLSSSRHLLRDPADSRRIYPMFPRRHCHILPEGVEFILLSPHKRGTADQLPKAFFARFPSNSKLSLVETLRCYLTATHTIRPGISSSKPDPLFVSYVKPQKPISAPSLAR